MNFGSMFQTWMKVLTNPGAEVFLAEREKPAATLTTGLVWMILAALVTALLGLLRTQLVASSLGGWAEIVGLMPPELRGYMEMTLNNDRLASMISNASLSSIIITPIFFIIGVGILHLVASVLGGRGQFGRYAYLNATFAAPLAMISALLGFVPVVGGCLGGILTIYGWVLTYFAIKVEYGLSDGRAIVVVLAPILAIFVLVLCVVVLAIALFIPMGLG